MWLDHPTLELLAPRLVGAAIIFLIALVGYRVVRRGLLLLVRSGRLAPAIAQVLTTATGWLVLITASLLALQEVGLLHNAWAMLTAVLAALAVGFVAVWSVLSNVLATVLLLIVRPFNLGDEIEIIDGGTSLRGKVDDLNLMFTTLTETNDQGPTGQLVQVPNNQFFQKLIRRRPCLRRERIDEAFFRRGEMSERVAPPSASEGNGVKV